MTAQAQIALWGFATVFPFVLNVRAKQGPDAVGLAGMLVVIWCIGRVLWALWSPPECLSLYPVLDSIAAVIAFTAWMSQPQGWKIILCALFVAQDCLHLAFWAAWPQASNLHAYLALNNTLFIGQLMCAASPGVGHVARSALRALLDRGGYLHHAGP